MIKADKRKPPTKADIHYMLQWYGVCAECNENLNGYYEADHIHQLSLGGKNTPENFRPLCKQCHKTKTADDAADRSMVKNMAGVTGQKARRKKNGPTIKSDKKIDGNATINSRSSFSGSNEINNNNKINSKGFGKW